MILDVLISFSKVQIYDLSYIHMQTGRFSTDRIIHVPRSVESKRAPHQAPVVRKLDNTVHRINRYPADKCLQNKLHYPLDSDLSVR